MFLLTMRMRHKMIISETVAADAICDSGLVKGTAKAPDIVEEDIDIMMSTNVTGLINMTQAVLPIFKKRESGDIINIGSIAGREGYPGGSIYCATKAAVLVIFSEHLLPTFECFKSLETCLEHSLGRHALWLRPLA